MKYSVGQIIYKKEYSSCLYDVIDIRRKYGTFYRIRELRVGMVLLECINNGKMEEVEIQELRTFKTLRKD
jgi:hypothetical protein